jgi:hypothetical protein
MKHCRRCFRAGRHHARPRPHPHRRHPRPRDRRASLGRVSPHHLHPQNRDRRAWLGWVSPRHRYLRPRDRRAWLGPESLRHQKLPSAIRQGFCHRLEVRCRLRASLPVMGPVPPHPRRRWRIPRRRAEPCPAVPVPGMQCGFRRRSSHPHPQRFRNRPWSRDRRAWLGRVSLRRRHLRPRDRRAWLGPVSLRCPNPPRAFCLELRHMWEPPCCRRASSPVMVAPRPRRRSRIPRRRAERCSAVPVPGMRCGSRLRSFRPHPSRFRNRPRPRDRRAWLGPESLRRWYPRLRDRRAWLGRMSPRRPNQPQAFRCQFRHQPEPPCCRHASPPVMGLPHPRR